MPGSYSYDAPMRSRAYSPSRRGDYTSRSKVPGQEGLPKGLNESYYREAAAALGVPMSEDSRAKSFLPQTNAVVRRRSRSTSLGSSYISDGGNESRDRSRSRGDQDQRRGFLRSSFSSTGAGVGAGIAGALVGGLVARQASHIAFRQKQKKSGRPRRHSAENVPRMVSTVLGVVAGGLGANALTHKLEDARKRRRNQYAAWDEHYDRDDEYSSYYAKHYDRDYDLDDGYGSSRGRGHRSRRSDLY